MFNGISNPSLALWGSDDKLTIWRNLLMRVLKTAWPDAESYPIPEKGDGFVLINVNFIAYSKYKY